MEISSGPFFTTSTGLIDSIDSKFFFEKSIKRKKKKMRVYTHQNNNNNRETYGSIKRWT